MSWRNKRFGGVGKGLEAVYLARFLSRESLVLDVVVLCLEFGIRVVAWFYIAGMNTWNYNAASYKNPGVLIGGNAVIIPSLIYYKKLYFVGL